MPRFRRSSNWSSAVPVYSAKKLKPGCEGSVTADDIIAFCRKNLARFKCPRHVVFVELPKTSTGKIQKFKLREQAEAL